MHRPHHSCPLFRNLGGLRFQQGPRKRAAAAEQSRSFEFALAPAPVTTPKMNAPSKLPLLSVHRSGVTMVRCHGPHAFSFSGAGFAGLWAALGAARRLDELGVAQGAVDITVVSSQPFHDIRVRNYEADLSPCRIPLQDLLDPAGVGHITADVTGIDPTQATVQTADGAMLGYDRLVVALGSRVAKPDLPGLAEFGFDVDTYDGATRLQAHIRALADRATEPASSTAVVVGAGLTGIETASELPRMLSEALGPVATPRVILVDHNPHVGSDMGESARPVIEDALAAQPRRHLDRGGRHRRRRAKRHALVRRGCAGGDGGVVRRHAGEPVDGAVRGAARPAGPTAGRRLPEGRGCHRGVRRRRCGRRAHGRRTHFGDVMSARSADGPLRGLQRDQRPAGRSHAVAANPLVCHRSRSRSGRCGVHGGLGSPGRQYRRGSQGDQTSDQR